MNWLDEVKSRMKRKNQILFSENSEFLSDLATLMEEQNHRTLVLWAFELADETVMKLNERYPNENRLATAVSASKDWAAGNVKMPVAQHAILQAHAVAKEIESPEDIALCHGIGQACSVVHTKRHAMGFPIYDLTALVRHYGISECEKYVEERKQQYMERIYYWKEHYTDHPCAWAEFMIKD